MDDELMQMIEKCLLLKMEEIWVYKSIIKYCFCYIGCLVIGLMLFGVGVLYG
jgi:hypothetical protein